MQNITSNPRKEDCFDTLGDFIGGLSADQLDQETEFNSFFQIFKKKLLKLYFLFFFFFKGKVWLVTFRTLILKHKYTIVVFELQKNKKCNEKAKAMKNLKAEQSFYEQKKIVTRI